FGSQQRGRSPGGSPRNRSVPDRRDLRKYARLFLRSDNDRDGFLTTEEARALFGSSGLSADMLARIWEVSNVSKSNVFSFPEFVAAMHLIRQARQGLPVPQDSLPGDLMSLLASLGESVADLAREGTSRSASRSRPASQPGSAPEGFQRASSPTFGGGQFVTSADDSANRFGIEHQPVPSFGEDMPVPSFGEEMPVWQGGQAEFAPDEHVDGKGKKEKDKKKKKKEKEQSPVFEQPAPSYEASTGINDEGPDTSSRQTAFHEGGFGFASAKSQNGDIGGATAGRASESRRPASSSRHGGGGAFSAAISASGSKADGLDMAIERNPSTRLGLQMPSSFETRDVSSKDPYYKARMEEILGIKSKPQRPDLDASELDFLRLEPPTRTAPVRSTQSMDREQEQKWAGRRHDGPFDQRQHNAYAHTGDYGSPALFAVLVGAPQLLRSASMSGGATGSAAGPLHEQPGGFASARRVLPAAAKPFLRTVTPNFPAELAAPAHFERPSSNFSIGTLTASNGYANH
ncbi:unnamed protein product, partial [Polarella glacialis]